MALSSTWRLAPFASASPKGRTSMPLNLPLAGALSSTARIRWPLAAKQVHTGALQGCREGSPVSRDMGIPPLKPHGENRKVSVPMRLGSLRKSAMAETRLRGSRCGEQPCLTRRHSKLPDKSVVEGRLASVSRLESDIENVLVATGKKRGR